MMSKLEIKDLTDAALAKRLKRNAGKVRLILTAGAVGAVAAGAALHTVLRDLPWKDWVPTGLLVLGIVVMILAQFDRRSNPSLERVFRLQGERLQAIRWKALIFTSLCLAVVAGLAALSEPLGWRNVIGFLCLCTVTLMSVTGMNLPMPQRQALEDELTLYNRNGAIRAGFWAAFLVGGGLLCLAQAAPDLAARGAPVAIAVPLVVAALRFAWLERTSALDG